MTSMWRLLIGLFWAACGWGGWFTTRIPAPARPAVAPAESRSTPALAPIPTGVKRNYLPASYVLKPRDKEFIKLDAQTIQAQIEGTREPLFEHCHAALPDASNDYCEQIHQATARVIPKFIDSRQRLLRGEIDSSTYQSQWHQHFIERQIALEQFMSYDDQVKFDSTPPGGDVFMDLNVWGMYLPEGFKMGLEDPPSYAQASEAGDAPPEGGPETTEVN